MCCIVDVVIYYELCETQTIEEMIFFNLHDVKKYACFVLFCFVLLGDGFHELPREKTNNLHMRKQRRRSASR